MNLGLDIFPGHGERSYKNDRLRVKTATQRLANSPLHSEHWPLSLQSPQQQPSPTSVLLAILQFISNTCGSTSSCQATAASSGCSPCSLCLLPCCYHYQSGVTTVSLTVLCLRLWCLEKQQQESEHAAQQRCLQIFPSAASLSLSDACRTGKQTQCVFGKMLSGQIMNNQIYLIFFCIRG